MTPVGIDHIPCDVPFPTRSAVAALDKDQPHLDPSRIAAMIGVLVAPKIASAPRRDGGPLPPPIHPWRLQEAEPFDLGCVRLDRTFFNSREKAGSCRIGVGESVTPQAPGRIACVAYVALPAGETLRVEEAGP